MAERFVGSEKAVGSNPTESIKMVEPQVLAKLSDKGYTVSKPFSDHCRYDLVIEKNGELERVQVKKAWVRDNGVVEFKTESTYANTKKYSSQTYTKEDIDVFAAYCPEKDTLYKVPVEEAPDTRMYIREIPAKNNQSKRINKAEDFKFD